MYLYLCEWAYSEYDTTEHLALGMSPHTAFNQGIAKYGFRTHRLIPDDENWRILTLPTTKLGRVKVHPTQGIQIRGIHYFPRYHAEIEEDREVFQSVVWGFQLRMPITKEPDLVPHWDYCYERSLGCVGILKNWFQNALFDAINEGSDSVELKHLERRALSVAQCRNILKKIKEGENNQAQIEAEVQQLRAELGLPIKSALIDNDIKQVEIEPQQGNSTFRRVDQKVGQPLPKRRQVGT